MNIAFYLDNSNHKTIDYSNPHNGNPGVGGTQFMIWLISCLLHERYKDIDIYLLANNIENMPSYMKCVKVQDVEDALKKSKDLGIEIFICRGPYLSRSFFELLDSIKIKTIVWSHNYETADSINYMFDCEYIKRNVCVSREQYEKLIDTKIYNKSCYIYNTINFSQYASITRNEINFNTICYIGSLHKSKGFARLAKIWPQIEKKVPQAELIVLGGGTLYNRNARLGVYGLAEDKYEKSFMKYLVDSEGKIKSNVHFKGIVSGLEKLEIMSSAGLGVVSPIGFDETYCLGAVEFEALGVPVVSVKKYALLDTVNNKKTGLLFKNDKQFVDNIIRLLNDNNTNIEMGKAGRVWVNEKFNTEKILEQWHDLILDVANNVSPVCEYKCHNLSNNRKWLRKINRVIQKRFTFMPSIIWYESIPHKIKKLLKI